MTDAVENIKKAHCASCGGMRNCGIRASFGEGHSSREYSWHRQWIILQCLGCETVFLQTVDTNSEDRFEYYDENGDPVSEDTEELAYWPPLLRRQMPEWIFPSGQISGDDKADKLSAPLRELYKALNADLLILSAIGARTCFDAASEYLGVDPALTFAEKLDALAAESHISMDDRSGLEVLVDAGSASAHRGWVPTVDEVNTMIDTLERFLKRSIVDPEERKRSAEATLKLATRIPQKQKKGAGKKLVDRLPGDSGI